MSIHLVKGASSLLADRKRGLRDLRVQGSALVWDLAQPTAASLT